MNNRTFEGFSNLDTFSNQYELNNPKQNIDKTSAGEHTTNTLGSVGALAGTGAAIGTLFGGPVGTAIGGGIGALAGLGKGLYDIFNTDQKESDMSKAADKFYAKQEQEKYAQLGIRRIGNDMKTAQAMNSINTQNLKDYTTPPTNDY